jgi:hypothetical protein
MDTALHSVARRPEPVPHVFAVSPLPTPATSLSARAEFRLSEAGRKASLLTGGNGREIQRLAIDVPLARLHLVHVDSAGIARLRLRPRYEVHADQRIVRHDDTPTYDAPPSLEALFQEAARNHELEAAYLAQRSAAVITRVDAEQAWRADVAQQFLTDPSQRALVHPSPTPRRCEIATARGRLRFDATRDRGVARDVPAEAYRRFTADLQQRREQAMRTREVQHAVHLKRRRVVHDWIAAHGTPDQQARVAAGMLPLDEGIEAMAADAFSGLAHLPTYARDGAARLQAHLRAHSRFAEVVVTPDTVAVAGRLLTEATATQWDVMEEIRRAVPDASTVLRERLLSTTAVAGAPVLRLVTVVATRKVGPVTLRREFLVPGAAEMPATAPLGRTA